MQPFSYLLSIVLILPVSAFPLQAQHTSFSKPNVICILADDLGYGDVSSCNKDSGIFAQHIDRLAAEGMLFTDAHTSSALCTLIIYDILTGRSNRYEQY